MIILITYNLHFANELDIHWSSKNDEESDKGHDLDLFNDLVLILFFISYKKWVQREKCMF